MDDTSPTLLRPPVALTARLIWGSLLLAVVAYWALLTALVPSRPDTDRLVPTVEATFLAVAAALTLVVWALHPRGEPAAPAADASGREAHAPLVRYVVCWALSEAIALFGLVSGLVARDAAAGTGLMLWSLALLVALRPRRDLP
jgi:hypothetical protein